jgi:hypothetical protein
MAPHLSRTAALAPVRGVTCAKCGRSDAAIYPVPPPRGMLVCPSCSPAWLRAWVADWSERQAAPMR